MGKFDGVLLASDFDNTLLNTETARRTGAEVPEVSRRNWEALEYFMAGGGRFAIATGRALAAFIKFADQVPMNAPGIVCNGAALYDFQKGEYLETTTSKLCPLSWSTLPTGSAASKKIFAARSPSTHTCL